MNKTIVFKLIPTLYFGVNITINYFLYTHQSIPIKESEVLIVGDSHPMMSLNPKYFHDSQNISQTGEPFVLTYWKLKKIFNVYIPDTIIIGFAPHNISQFNDWKFSHEKWSYEIFERSYPIQEFNKISIDFLAFYKTLWKQIAFYPKKDHINYIGGYSNKNGSDLSDSIGSIKRHYYENGNELGVSEFAVNYLDSIVELCDSKKTELIMVSNPVHNQYLRNIPIAIMEKYVDLTKKHDINHIVFDKTTVNYPDSLYFNSDHLNEKGAKKFTSELIEFLKTTNASQVGKGDL
ncbi:MAG: hypothetical protein JXR10_03675 [Cyclobacteriaceae bacterium]